MQRFVLVALASAAATLNALGAQAQISIRDLQRNTGIAISGEIRDVVGNEFILDDGTGRVIVDAGPRWYHQLNFKSGDRVTVIGEYDDGEFDAFSITYADGRVIQVRPADGPPPWAGGRGQNRS